MEISEVRNHLRGLENKIEELIFNFEKTTNYGVHSITIKSLTQCEARGSKTEILSVNIDLSPSRNNGRGFADPT
jgi:hypothetical protein